MLRSTDQKLSSPARRHFLASSAGIAGRLAVSAALAAAAMPWSREAEARRHGHGHGKGKGGGGKGGGGKGGGGTNCFLQGTRILTADGEMCIEDLRIGDRVMTVRGEALPVKWIGRNTFRKSPGRPWPDSVMPIRVARFAIDEQTPRRDLYLSPGHALFVDGFLMPVKDLVNGASIAPAAPSAMDSIEYYQIVLDTHEAIWAEGTPVETFLAKRGTEIEAFTNFVEYKRLYPNDAGPTMPLAPNLGTTRAHLSALLGVGMSYFVEKRNPLDEAYARIAARAEELEPVG